MKDNLTVCMPAIHPIEICYNSSFIYADSTYASISKNLFLHEYQKYTVQ